MNPQIENALLDVHDAVELEQMPLRDDERGRYALSYDRGVRGAGKMFWLWRKRFSGS